MKKLLLFLFICISTSTLAQEKIPPSIHQQQADHYGSLGLSTDAEFDSLNQYRPIEKHSTRGGCNLNKVVFGWHPYWVGSAYNNYDWDLLTDFSFFSYEVDAATGDPLTTHGWATSNAVTVAQANGVRVNLCVTLFSNHNTFFGSATAQANLIQNLVDQVQLRNADGINIDFEGIPAGQATNFTNFMVTLCNTMHDSVPGSQVSMALFSVDWNNVFNISVLNQCVDLFVIMGYGYYWSGSSNAGPVDPLYSMTTGYNYNLSRTTTYYLDQGVTPSKLIMGLPYYGYEWPTSGATAPSSTTGSGYARTYAYVRNNTSGNYSNLNKQWEANSFTPYYSFNSSGQKQCFINDDYSLGKRLQFINQRGIGGLGIWALGYDDGYLDYWDEIETHFTDCGVVACSDTIYDMGGPTRDYYDDEDYTYTIAPTNASGLSLNFLSFDVELNYDTLWIYDGPDINSPLVGAYTGTNSPGLVTASGNSLTVRFNSDGATTNPGWMAIWTCTIDSIPPTTQMATNTWETDDFNVAFTDADNSGGSGLDEQWWIVSDKNAGQWLWRSSGDHGFYNDEFTIGMHPDWTSMTGTWSVNSGSMQQSDENEGNSNIYASLTQTNADSYLYHWRANMSGTGTNRRSGIHFFCDDATLPNRGNSYFVYYRVDNDKCQIYKVVNDAWTLMTDDDVNIDPNQWYDLKVMFDPGAGLIQAYLDDVLVSQWTDPSPHTSGNAISLRSGGTDVRYDDLRVWKKRGNSETVTIGTSADMVRYQNDGPGSESCRINSLVNDIAGNWSTPTSLDVNIDWTPPTTIADVNDGIAIDIDTTFINTELAANWTSSVDTNSLVADYWYAIGDTPGDSNIVAWTNNGPNTAITHTGLNLINGQVYYFSVRATNNAGLVSATTTSDGQLVTTPSNISQSDHTENEWLVYPNPFRDEVTIEQKGNPGVYQIRLYDLSGRMVHEQDGTGLQTVVSLSHLGLPAAQYILELHERTEVEYVRLTKF